MPEKRDIIIRMIKEGKRNKDILKETGFSSAYIEHTRADLKQDSLFYEKPTLRPHKPKKTNNNIENKYARNRPCLGVDCDKVFFSEDARYITRCPDCRDHPKEEQEGFLGNTMSGFVNSIRLNHNPRS